MSATTNETSAGVLEGRERALDGAVGVVVLYHFGTSPSAIDRVVGKFRAVSQHTSPKWPELSIFRLNPSSRRYPRFRRPVEVAGVASMQSAHAVAVAERGDIHKSCRALEAIVNLLDDYSEAARAIVTLHKKLARALRDAVAVKPTGEIPSASSCTFRICRK